MPHHADAELASDDAEKHLREGRHGEWTATSLAESQSKAAHRDGSASWGVTLTLPGWQEGEPVHPEVVEALRRQHAR